MAEIAVIMPHRGGDAFLCDAVASILRQEGDVPLKLYLVDDASPTHGWLDAIGPWRADPRLVLLQTDRQVGPFRITNWVLQNSDEPYIAFHDADDWSAPNRLSLQLKALKAGRTDIVGSGFFIVEEDGAVLRTREMPRDVNRAHRRGNLFAILHATTAFRRSVLQCLGGFDGTDIGVGADTEFYLRATFACRMRNLPMPLYYYRQHPASLTAAKDTGARSVARDAYVAKMYRQHYRRLGLWEVYRITPGRDSNLMNRPNDVSFEVRRPRMQ